MNSKIVTTVFLIAYLAMLPVWLMNVTIEQAIAFYFMYWFMCDFIQSLFLHRWASHNLWNPPVWWQYVASTLGTLALVGSPIGWAAWHRTHHYHVDTERDPHSPNHKSWLYIVFKYKWHGAETKRAVDRLRNKWFAYLHNHEVPIVILGNLIIFAVLPFQWFLTLWALPVAFMVFNTNFFVNVLLHKSGKPIDSPWLWPILFSETHHGSHHDKPKLSYTKLDPAGWIITKLGWAK